MSIELLEDIVKKTLAVAKKGCNYTFQGGEPTLVGLSFYKKLIEFQNKYNVNKIKISNAIQTNGIVIDDDWARFFAENDFLVGISLDGNKELHDSWRTDSSGRGTFIQVMRAIRLFEKHKVKFNILTVVNKFTARHVRKVYNFFKENDFRYLQFIPCLDPFGDEPGKQEYSLEADRYTYFLKNLFDLWYDDIIKGKDISIRYFDNIVGMFMGLQPEACGMLGFCQANFVVEADGGVYPCDFYVTDDWYMGNIKDSDLEDLRKSASARRFIETSLQPDPECRSCHFGSLCRGGCRRNRDFMGNGNPGHNYYCSSFKDFFAYTVERFRHIAKIYGSSNYIQ